MARIETVLAVPAPVPGHLRDLIGRTEWIETLPARNRSEADRLAIPYISETNRIIELEAENETSG